MNDQQAASEFSGESRWRVVTGGLMLGALLMALVLFLPSAVTLPLVDPATLPLGPLIGDAPVFVYYPELAQISLVQEGERTFLRVDSDNRGDERYNGFGFFGEFVVPQNAALRFEWRGTVKGHSPSLHIVDASPDRPRPDRGEIYTWKMPYPESEWQVLEIALSNFRRDEEQFEDVPNDGVLHSNGIPNVEIGFELNTYAQLDFRHAGFVWSAPRGPTYLALVLGLVTGVLLLVHSSRLRGVSARLDSPSGDDSATVVYPLTCLVLTVSVLADVQHTLTITEALALSGMFVLVVVDKLLASTSRSHVFWDLRYVILLSGIWWVGEALPPLFPVVLLFVALLSAASKQRRGVLLTAAALPLAAVVLRPPLLDISDKGPTLFYITMVGALALGAAEILRSSEVRDQHRRTAMMYRGILEQISDGVVLVEFNGRIELANRGFESLLSADPGELLGHHVSDFLRAKDGRPANLLTLSTVGDKSEMTLANSVTGLRRDVLVAAHTVRHKDLPDRLQLTVSDISERKLIERELTRANERLSRLSATDELTGLDNRREFERSLTSEWSRCARSGLPLTVLYCDIDAFKAYNDCYGHRAGDKALQCVADALTGCLNRPGDSVARYGGEEFLVLLPETNPEKIEAFTEKIRATIEELGLPHAANSAASVLTVSIGVASCVPSQDNSGEELIHAADMALYEAKNSGRNRVVFHDPSTMNPR